MLPKLKSALSKVVNGFGSKTVSWIAPLMDFLTANECDSYEKYLTNGSRRVWASFRACDLIAKAVQSTPRAIYKRGGTDPVDIPELTRLLSYPNRFETFDDLIWKTIIHLRWTGSGYWYKSESTLTGDRPKELIGLNPKNVKISVNARGEIIGYLYTHCGKVTPFEVDEIIHFKRPHPDNDYYGLGDFEAGRELINEWLNRQDFSKKFWQHGAAPSGLLICEDQVTDDQMWKRAKAEWQREYGGKSNAGKTAWLTGKWRFERTGLSTSEMQEIERIKLTTEQIFQLHGVPLSLGGIKEAANYATAEIDDRNFRQYTVLPDVRLLQATMNTDLVGGWGNFEVRWEVAGLVDTAKVVRDFTPLFDRGAVSLNELRAKAGFQIIKGNPLFDQHFINAGLVPLELSGVADIGQTEDEAEKTVRRFLTAKPQQLENT